MTDSRMPRFGLPRSETGRDAGLLAKGLKGKKEGLFLRLVVLCHLVYVKGICIVILFIV